MDRVIKIRIVAFVFAAALLLFFVFLDTIGRLDATIFWIVAFALIIRKLWGWWSALRFIDKTFLDNSKDR